MASQLPLPEARMLEAIDASEMLSNTLAWSSINSGTGNLAGLASMATALSDAFSVLPGEIALEQPETVTSIAADGEQVKVENGNHLVLRVRPDAERRFLLTGHMDTVFPPEHSFQETRWLDDDTLNGPGTADMKGGLAVILAALKALETFEGAGSIGYDVLINSDEETGSLSSAPLITRLAGGKYAALTYEPSALPDGTLVHARGGTGNFSVTVTGRSAHAGRNPQDGRNAIVAVSLLAVELKALEHANLSVNPARIDGGNANNVVPDHAVLRFNIRPRRREDAEKFERDFSRLRKEIAEELEVSLSVHGGVTRPPKPVDANAQRLFDLVKACGADLGQSIAWQDSGGVCDGNNIASCGIPVVDTLGVRGGAIHSPDEFLIVHSLQERAELSALILSRLATDGW